ncbi:hypothetical protein HK101_004964, partial [Irineochytrium annulatum]
MATNSTYSAPTRSSTPNSRSTSTLKDIFDDFEPIPIAATQAASPAPDWTWIHDAMQLPTLAMSPVGAIADSAPSATGSHLAPPFFSGDPADCRRPDLGSRVDALLEEL